MLHVPFSSCIDRSAKNFQLDPGKGVGGGGGDKPKGMLKRKRKKPDLAY